MRRLGLNIPIQPVRAPVSQTGPTSYSGTTPVWSPHVAFRPKRDGSFYIGNGYREIDAEYDLGFHTYRDLKAFWPTFVRNWRMVRPRFGREALHILAGQIRGRHVDLPDAEPKLSRRIVTRNLANFRAALPTLQAIEEQRSWAGRIDATPDLIPILDRVGPDGLFLVAGFNGHGFALSPVIGLLIAEWILHGRTHLDLGAFSLSRFARPAPKSDGMAF